MSKKALVAIADRIEEVEAFAIVDCLRRANVDVTVASVQNLQISSSRDVKISADCLIADCLGRDYDLIALPGGMPGAEHLAACSDLVKMLKKQKADGKYYAAICASPAVVLDAHGLLHGKKCTCHPSMSEKISGRTYLNQRVVVDGNCITSQGPGTALEFAIKLVELLCGIEKAAALKNAMLIKC